MQTDRNTVVVKQDGRVEIPAAALCEASVEPGQSFTVQVTAGGIWLRPADRDPDQWWYWTPEFQAGEAEDDDRCESGEHQTTDEFIAKLEALSRP